MQIQDINSIFIKTEIIQIMKETFRKNWLVAFAVVIISCFAFAACGSDSEGKSDEPESTKSVVGIWKNDDGDIITFEKNNDYTIAYDTEYGIKAEIGTWSVKNDIMTRIYTDENGEKEVEVYTIITHTEKLLILRYEGEYVGQFTNYYEKDNEKWVRIE